MFQSCNIRGSEFRTAAEDEPLIEKTGGTLELAGRTEIEFPRLVYLRWFFVGFALVGFVFGCVCVLQNIDCFVWLFVGRSVGESVGLLVVCLLDVGHVTGV